MAQLNFFTPYLKQQKTSPIRNKGIIILIVFLLIAGSFFALQLQIMMIKNKIVDNNKLLESEEMVERVKIKGKLDELTQTYDQTEKIVKAMSEADFIKLQLLKDIMTTVPQNLRFEELTLDRNKWQINGVANNRQLIAEFEYNLKKGGFITTSLVETITETENSNYSFEMKGNFGKVVVEDEN